MGRSWLRLVRQEMLSAGRGQVFREQPGGVLTSLQLLNIKQAITIYLFLNKFLTLAMRYSMMVIKIL